LHETLDLMPLGASNEPPRTVPAGAPGAIESAAKWDIVAALPPQIEPVAAVPAAAGAAAGAGEANGPKTRLSVSKAQMVDEGSEGWRVLGGSGRVWVATLHSSWGCLFLGGSNHVAGNRWYGTRLFSNGQHPNPGWKGSPGDDPSLGAGPFVYVLRVGSVRRPCDVTGAEEYLFAIHPEDDVAVEVLRGGAQYAAATPPPAAGGLLLPPPLVRVDGSLARRRDRGQYI